MKILLLFMLLPLAVNASVKVINNTSASMTVENAAGTTLATVATNTTVTVSPAGFASDLYLTVSSKTYGVEVIDGGTVSMNPTYEVISMAPASAWLEYFYLGFKVQMAFELFGFMIRLAGALRKPSGAEL